MQVHWGFSAHKKTAKLLCEEDSTGHLIPFASLLSLSLRCSSNFHAAHNAIFITPIHSGGFLICAINYYEVVGFSSFVLQLQLRILLFLTNKRRQGKIISNVNEAIVSRCRCGRFCWFFAINSLRDLSEGRSKQAITVTLKCHSEAKWLIHSAIGDFRARRGRLSSAIRIASSSSMWKNGFWDDKQSSFAIKKLFIADRHFVVWCSDSSCFRCKEPNALLLFTLYCHEIRLALGRRRERNRRAMFESHISTRTFRLHYSISVVILCASLRHGNALSCKFSPVEQEKLRQTRQSWWIWLLSWTSPALVAVNWRDLVNQLFIYICQPAFGHSLSPTNRSS